MNPFTLKELRQLTRSKIIAGTLIGFLFFALLLAYFIPVGEISYNTGSALFGSITIVLGLLTIFIVPANVFVRMMKERGGKKAADLTLATALKPSSIIDGKIRSALALIGLSLSATLPFASFAYLLHGISLAQMAETLLAVGLLAALVVHFAILVASLRLSPVFRWIIYISILIQNSFVLVGGGIVQVSIMSGDAFNRPFLIFAAIVVSLCILARAFAIATLTPRTREHDFELRMTTLLLSLAWGIYAFSWWREPITDAVKAIEAWTGLTLFVFIMLAIGASAQPVGYSRRQLASFEAMPMWRRFLFWPFMSGAANGLFFAIVGALIVSLVMPLLTDKINARFVAEKVYRFSADHCTHIRTLDHAWVPFVFVLYNSAILLFFRALWRVATKWWTNLSPVLVFICSLFTIAFLQTLPELLGCRADLMPFCYRELGREGISVATHFIWSLGAFAFAVATNLIVHFLSDRRHN